MPNPLPASAAPELEVETLGGERFVLADRRPGRFTMVVFYRGLHCPVCKTYLRELSRKLEDFSERGTEVIAVSGDSAERAAESHDDWDLGELTIGHGLGREAMDAWGLYVSTAITDEEADEFSEPGLFLIDTEGEVFYAAVQNMPFGRPSFDELIGGLDFVIENDYPPRGVTAPAGAAA